MCFWKLVPIEFCKLRRSPIVPLIFAAPFLVTASGVASLSAYFTPEYSNAWVAMFIQSALLYAYYLLPFSMIVVCVMLAERERSHNGLLKMQTLPVSRSALCLAKFLVLTFSLLMELLVFFAVFVAAGQIASAAAGLRETLPLLYLLRQCAGLFFTMLPCLAAMWAVTVLSDKPIVSVGVNLLLVIPGVLAANTPLWVVYPYCYSGYLISCALGDFSRGADSSSLSLFPFLPCALLLFFGALALAVTRFGKK